MWNKVWSKLSMCGVNQVICNLLQIGEIGYVTTDLHVSPACLPPPSIETICVIDFKKMTG